MKLKRSELRQIVREEILNEVGYRRPHGPAATPWTRQDTGSRKPQPISRQEREAQLRGKWPERKVGGEKQVHADWPEIQHAKWSKKDLPVIQGFDVEGAAKALEQLYSEEPKPENEVTVANITAFLGGAPEDEDSVRDELVNFPKLQHIKEATPAITHDFAATASEEAKKINDQLGPDIYNMTLVTDQEHWASMGIHTGEELAISLLNSTYSDLYKSIHGIRPRHRFKNVNDVTDALNDLEEYYDEVVTQREFDIQRQKEIDREKAELDALMPGKFDFEHEPKQVGMGRGAALKELRQIVRSTITEMMTRRGFLKGLGGAAGVAAVSSVPGLARAGKRTINVVDINGTSVGQYSPVASISDLQIDFIAYESSDGKVLWVAMGGLEEDNVFNGAGDLVGFYDRGKHIKLFSKDDPRPQGEGTGGLDRPFKSFENISDRAAEALTKPGPELAGVT